MENVNVQNAAAITDQTTLGELLAMLDLSEKAGKVPTRTAARSSATDSLSTRISLDVLLSGCLTVRASPIISISSVIPKRTH